MEDRIDEDKICYLFAVNSEEENHLSKMFLFGQYILASFEESIQFGWVNCAQQMEFCSSMKLKVGEEEGNEGTFQIVAVKAYREYYQLYYGGKRIVLKKDSDKNKEMV